MQRIHFSPVHLDSVRQRREYGKQAVDDKPCGFWFSVQSAEPEWSGWLEWNRSEDFFDIDNQAAHRLDVDETRILRIGPGDLDWFNKTFCGNKYPGQEFRHTAIDWKIVSAQFAGIEISPYSWEHRHHRSVRWYYGWDCASGCIWDTTAIKSITRIPLCLVESRPGAE